MATFSEMLRWICCGLVGVMLSTGCVVVKAHQRGDLAKRSMTNDVDTGQGRFQSHERGAREGADGGTNHPGGGCGCN